MFRRALVDGSCAVRALWPDVELVTLPRGASVSDLVVKVRADVVCVPPSRSAVSLARRLPCPVLMCPADQVEAESRIVGAVGTPQMDDAVLATLKNAAADGSEVVLTYVDTAPAMMRDCVTGGGLAYVPVPAADPVQRFSSLLSELWHQGVRARLRVESGSVGAGLVNAVAEERPRLALVGVAPRSWWPQAGLGLQLVRRTGRPVLLQRRSS